MGSNYHLKRKNNYHPFCYTEEDWSEKEDHKTIDINLKPLENAKAKTRSLDVLVYIEL